MPTILDQERIVLNKIYDVNTLSWIVWDGSLSTGGVVIGAVTQSGVWNVGLSAGTNNIGDVDVLTLPALPAGTNNIGDVDVLSLPAITGAVTVSGTVTAALPVAAGTSLSSVAGSASSVTLLAANSARRMVLAHNNSTAILYMEFAATASTSSFRVRLRPQAYWEMPTPIYTGVISGIWASATGTVLLTEIT